MCTAYRSTSVAIFYFRRKLQDKGKNEYELVQTHRLEEDPQQPEQDSD